MTTVATRNARFPSAAWLVVFAALTFGKGAVAQPAPPDPPASAASGPTEAELSCKRRPQLCAALHRANKELIAAVKANQKGQYVCTTLNHQPGCSTTPPKAYVTPKGSSPYGNPGDIEEGRRLLDWYLKNLSCEALCKPKQEPQQCERACGQGESPGKFPDTGATTKPGKPH